MLLSKHLRAIALKKIFVFISVLKGYRQKSKPGLSVFVKTVTCFDVNALQVVQDDHHLRPVDGSARGQHPVIGVNGSADIQANVGSHLEAGVEQDAQLGADQQDVRRSWGTLFIGKKNI